MSELAAIARAVNRDRAASENRDEVMLFGVVLGAYMALDDPARMRLLLAELRLPGGDWPEMARLALAGELLE
jgi:hypothetical protein